jgi:hypothetical protein
VVEEITLHQGAFREGATDLHFKVWQKEDNIDINGWAITISHFTDSASKRGDQPDSAPDSPHSTLMNLGGVPPTSDPDNGLHAIDVEAKFRVTVAQRVPYCTFITIRVTLWLTSYNTIRIADCRWTKGSDSLPATGDFGWEIGFPLAVTSQPGKFQHLLAITNDSRTGGSFAITNVRALASAIDYNDPVKAPIEGGLRAPDLVVKNGESTRLDIQTDGRFLGSFIYHTFAIGQFPGDPNALVVMAQHVVVPPPIPTPTTSQWGLLLLVFMIGAAGVIVIVRRKHPLIT